MTVQEAIVTASILCGTKRRWDVAFEEESGSEFVESETKNVKPKEKYASQLLRHINAPE